MSGTQILENDSFHENIVVSKKNYLVDFWASWCAPCRAIIPLIDELAVEYKDKVHIAKLNVDENRDTAVKYHVSSIPTLIFFKDGKEVDRITGSASKSILKEKLDKIL